MAAPRLPELMRYMEERHPRSVRGVREAAEIPGFEAIAEMFLGWAFTARGERAIPACADAFVGFSTAVTLAQARYERDGHYPDKSQAECYDELYGRDEMADYLWGVYFTNFLWPHHLEIGLMFRDRFVARLTDDASIVELAPGHGGWGVWALHATPQARLRGYDISPSSIAIASSIAAAAGAGERAEYHECNVLELAGDAPSASACISCFLVEHLDDPDGLFHVIGEVLEPGGLAFITGALTAAQVDHVYEFKRESELVAMAENHGLRVLETFSGSPRRTLPKAKFLPRSMALIAQRRTHETW